jgi:hypothetical protein
MAKAKSKHSTPRRTAPKIKPKPKNTAERSEIIEQCVIYVQQLAAYDAGFDVDHTGDSDYAGKGGQIKKARRAMCKLIGLSPHKTPGAKPLTPLELHAKAGVLAAMYGLRKHEQPGDIEQAYIRFFAGEVSDFLASHQAVQS